MKISKYVREHVMATSTVILVSLIGRRTSIKRGVLGGRVNGHFIFLEKESSRADPFLYIDQE